MNWYELTLKDVLGFLLVVVVVGVALYLGLGYPVGLRARSNFGFGPEWECTYPGKGDPICFKRPAAEARPHQTQTQVRSN